MARPREVKFGNGKITLTNIEPDVCDKLEEHLESFGKEIPAPTYQPSGDTPEIAMGFLFDKQKDCFETVVVKYNPSTKEAKVESVDDAGITRNEASNKFKTLCLKYGLI